MAHRNAGHKFCLPSFVSVFLVIPQTDEFRVSQISAVNRADQFALALGVYRVAESPVNTLSLSAFAIVAAAAAPHLPRR
jgi:hypothetical protein